jgi:hypothetical protein
VAIAVGAFRVSLRSVTAAETRIAGLERLRTSVALIDSQLQSQAPMTYKTEEGGRRYYFSGDFTRLQFATNYSLWGGETGCVVVSYDDGGRDLYASERLFMAREGGRETVLLRGADEIYFEYYGVPESDQESPSSAVSEDNKIPARVRINIAYGRKSFSLLIPTRVNETRQGAAAPADAASDKLKLREGYD